MLGWEGCGRVEGGGGVLLGWQGCGWVELGGGVLLGWEGRGRVGGRGRGIFTSVV